METESTNFFVPGCAGKLMMCKQVNGKLAGDSMGSDSKLDIEYFEAIEPEWMMLGHGVKSADMVLVKEGPLVKRATRWKRIWCNLNSGKRTDYAMYIPESDDPDYVACGVVFVFGVGVWDWLEPSSDLAVALVHKSVVNLAAIQSECWSDEGTNSQYNVNLNLVPRIGTAWPSMASLIGKAPPCFEFKPSIANKLIPNGPYMYSLLPVRMRNTFLEIRDDEDDLLGELRNRQTRSWPSSRTNSPTGAVPNRQASSCLPMSTLRQFCDLVATQAELSSSPVQVDLEAEVVSSSPNFEEDEDSKFGSITADAGSAILGSPELPTLGSAGHWGGSCKPCAFADSCKSGAMCRFCHLCKSKLKKRGRWNLKRTKEESELAAELVMVTAGTIVAKDPVAVVDPTDGQRNSGETSIPAQAEVAGKQMMLSRPTMRAGYSATIRLFQQDW